jgi:hypothetical protein
MGQTATLGWGHRPGAGTGSNRREDFTDSARPKRPMARSARIISIKRPSLTLTICVPTDRAAKLPFLFPFLKSFWTSAGRRHHGPRSHSTRRFRASFPAAGETSRGAVAPPPSSSQQPYRPNLRLVSPDSSTGPYSSLCSRQNKSASPARANWKCGFAGFGSVVGVLLSPLHGAPVRGWSKFFTVIVFSLKREK